MSDNTQPASSRRALREKRRAEMEALLANSKAEQEAREQAAKEQKSGAASPSEPSDAPKQSAAKKPTASTPAAILGKKPSPAPKPEASKPAAPQAKPAAAKPSSPKAKPTATEPKSKPAPTAAPPADATAKKNAKPTPAAAATPAKTPAAAGTAAASAPNAKPAEGAEASAEPVLGERASLRRARDREALRERRRLQDEVSELTTNVPTVEAAEEPKPLTRRQLRLQALAEQQKGGTGSAETSKPLALGGRAPAHPTEDATDTTVMSVEEALAARRKHSPALAVDPTLLGDDDNEIDLEVLAHQREMAARAAIISRRAAERERLRQENVKAGKEDTAHDPFTGAMGNIREFEDKVSRSGVSGPRTESVELNLESTSKVAPAKPAPVRAKQAKDVKPVSKPAPKPAAKPSPTPATGPKKDNSAAKPVQRTTAPVKQADEEAVFDVVDLPRVGAVEAQGLQPLDAQTAGVRRANNMFLAMIAALAVGGIALVAGIIMMFSN